jgi:hypothetical protein
MSPPSPISQGQCVALQWNVQGSLTSVKLYRNNDLLWDNAPYEGSYPQDCPGAGQYTYLLQANGPGGQAQANQYLQVNAQQPTPTPVAPTPTPAPPTDTPVSPTDTPVPPTDTPVPPTDTPVPPTDTPVPQPEIYSFSAQPSQILTGECVTLAWSTGGGAASVDITRNADLIVDNGPTSGSQQDCPPAPMPGGGQVTYTVTATNQAGTTLSQAAVVMMMGPLPPTDTPVPPPDAQAPPPSGG